MATRKKRKRAAVTLTPTKGLRIRSEQGTDDWGPVAGEYVFVFDHHKLAPIYIHEAQAKVDADYINRLIEADEIRRDSFAQHQAENTDLFVNVGDMSDVSQADIQSMITAAGDAEYEAMVEDLIGNFNHIVMQGIKPLRALFAFSQAYAIVTGYCLRAQMPFQIAKDLLVMIMNNANVSEKMVRFVTQSRAPGGGIKQ